MKKIILIIASTLIFVELSLTQRCVNDFQHEMNQNFEKNEEVYKDLVYKSLKSSTNKVFDSLINPTKLDLEIVPFFIFNFKEEVNTIQDIDKKDLLCYLNPKNIILEEAFLYIDAAFFGVVLSSGDYSENYSLHDKDSHYLSHMHILELSQKVKDISPKFLFRLSLSNDVYWYMANGELSVLSFNYHPEGKGLINFKKHSIKDYINKEFEKSDMYYLEIAK